MMLMSLNLQFWASLMGALLGQGARVARRKSVYGGKVASGVKLIAGVPVHNYHLSQNSVTRASVEERWIVIASPGTTDDQLKEMCQNKACEQVGHPSEGGVAFVEVRGTEQDLEELLRSAPGVAQFVEPDIPVYAIPDEPEGAVAGGVWGLQRIGATNRAQTGAGVNVYVCDTGIRVTHSEFGGRAIPAYDATKKNKECGSSTDCAADMQGHGTHCSGTVAGETFGVAPGAIVHAVKVLGDNGGGQLGWMVGGLDYVASSGRRPAVASMSLGAAAVVEALRTAVDAAVAEGVTVVVAAGNSNNDACKYSPAFAPSAITVGSTRSDDVRSIFSNWGSCVNIWAPGTGIESASNKNDAKSVTHSGTSMACPHVAGAVALLLEVAPLKPSEVVKKLVAIAESNALSDLTPLDANKLIWVGKGPAPSPSGPMPPTRPPTPACQSPTSSGPGLKGECRCNLFKKCYTGGKKGCRHSGGMSNRYFMPYCQNCVCK